MTLGPQRKQREVVDLLSTKLFWLPYFETPQKTLHHIYNIYIYHIAFIIRCYINSGSILLIIWAAVRLFMVVFTKLLLFSRTPPASSFGLAQEISWFALVHDLNWAGFQFGHSHSLSKRRLHPPKTNGWHQKIDLWKRRFLLETIILGVYVSLI